MADPQTQLEADLEAEGAGITAASEAPAALDAEAAEAPALEFPAGSELRAEAPVLWSSALQSGGCVVCVQRAIFLLCAYSFFLWLAGVLQGGISLPALCAASVHCQASCSGLQHFRLSQSPSSPGILISAAF